MLQGMTAHYLTHSTLSPQAGRHLPGACGAARRRADRANGQAAGCARVRNRLDVAKAEIARGHGATNHLYTRDDFDAAVRRSTSGRGVDVVYDSVGATTFERSLNSLRTRRAPWRCSVISGPVAPFDPSILECQGLAVSHPFPAWAIIF